jgi:DNA-binding CsgD family transcriptional regulator
MGLVALLARNDLIAFARACEQADTLAALEALWRARMTVLGFHYAALGAHVDPLRPDQATYVFQNYPEDWIAHFSAQRYHLIDPVFRSVEAGRMEFQWADPDFIRTLSWRQKRVLAEAREHGLRFGRTHALASTIHLKASASLITDAPDVDEDTYAAARLANVLVHHRAAQICAGVLAPVAELSARERQCLELCASGLTDAVIGRSIGVSAATVRRHIEAARLRLGAATRIQAAVRAISSGQIKPFDP